MCKIGLFDYLRQAGNVYLHGQNTLSNTRYDELKSAQKMIKNYLKNTNLKVDIYDGNAVPKDKFVYAKAPDCVFIEVTDLLSDKVRSAEFFDQVHKEPVLRRIFQFVEKANGLEETQLKRMIDCTRIKYSAYLRRMGKI